MTNAALACEVLRNLRAYQSCRMMDGATAIVMAQLRERVTVPVGAVVLVVNRWELEPHKVSIDAVQSNTCNEPIATVEFSEDDLAWFRRPAKEVA